MTLAVSGATLAQTTLAQQGVVGTGETVVFWILGPLALLGALGMVFARSAVHSALWLVLTMLSLGVLYMAQSAQFLGFTQIIVYTGAIMMLFLFVLMVVGRDASDSVVEVLRGQRLAAAVLGVAFAALLVAGLARSLTDVVPAAPLNPWAPGGGAAGGLGQVIFTDYLFPFELTSALLITASLGAMVLAYGGKGRKPRMGQRETVEARFRGEYSRPSPLPGPGVYATANSVATPALLPDGSVAEDSLSDILDTTPVERLRADRTAVSGRTGQPDAHALTGQPTREGGADGGTERPADADAAVEGPASGSAEQGGSPGGSAASGGGTDDGATNGKNGRGEDNGSAPAGNDGVPDNPGTDADSPEEVRQ
ncbi:MULTISPECIES: NADH-quinone oxidoreductase subunit J [unclassified Actinopolyspora]|uniref:NADH-quinone oxidoreductase subunit J n=1 Tax=unclassified Actinopolyspora TaxID=2639451 RepID=UPI0013F673A3|nr:MULTISPECIES: NADH-quinone oxidoreductase subunit J [unclassified Actinopolyspora]NHD16531.1 NADH-quinone oxidoreductase subunit J [Actinopolyspora sp. BKK2]NHE75606.1 NADH-quinone oxidoreductase subunit J [Actinopolyspora sp. BKK1]